MISDDPEPNDPTEQELIDAGPLAQALYDELVRTRADRDKWWKKANSAKAEMMFCDENTRG